MSQPPCLQDNVDTRTHKKIYFSQLFVFCSVFGSLVDVGVSLKCFWLTFGKYLIPIGRFEPSLRALPARHEFNGNLYFLKIEDASGTLRVAPSRPALRARGLVKSFLKS